MVRIDNKIREVVNQIKQEEAKLANLVNKIEDAAPEVSVATQKKATSLKYATSLQDLLHFIKN